MTASDTIKDIIGSTYAARVRGDVEGTVAHFAEDVVFEFNGRGTGAPALAGAVKGLTAVRPVIQQLIELYRFSDWQEVSLLVDGERAALHWRATVTVTGNGRAAKFDVFDFFSFRDGKITALHQSTDTAAIKALVAD